MDSTARTVITFVIMSTIVCVHESHGAILRVPEEYETLRAALANAAEGDEILLAAGVYSGDGYWGLEPPAVTVTIRGDGGRDAVTINGSDLDQQLCGFIIGSIPAGQSLRIEDLTIAEFSSETWYCKGMRVWGGGAMNVSRCRFRDCGTSDDNPYWGDGAALSLNGGVYVYCEDTEFIRNRTYQGGAIAVLESARCDIVRCTFYDNIAADGGAIHIWTSEPTLIDGCTFIGNGASWQGGALDYVHIGAQLTVRGTVFAYNGASTHGGAIACLGAQGVVMEQCTIVRNYAGAKGGGVSAPQGRVKFDRCIVRENCAGTLPEDGQDVYLDGVGEAEVECSCLDRAGFNEPWRIVESGEQVWDDPKLCGEGICNPWSYSFDESAFALSADSPCAPWNSPCGERIGALDVRCNWNGLGACCVADTCVMTTESECAVMAGSFQGIGSLCDSSSCLGTPIEVSTWGGVKLRFGSIAR